ncbi:MAG: aminotransferase class I/II-fold pyridoxal phosphate-dependent enzyme [Flammeovirgaceae bacterium]
MSAIISAITQAMDYGLARGLVYHHTEDETLNGRTVLINGKNYINFGSCSYLGLEKHPKLVEGVMQAVQKYGTQFSSSRTYLSIGQYHELETQFEALFGQPAIVTASTTLGHLATLPVIIDAEDAVILDLQVHSSVQMASQLLKTNKVPIHVIRHNSMEQLEDKIQKLRNKHRKIWYLADGIYSMYGDFAPMQPLFQLLEQYKQLHLYIDDAHGMGWTGKNGMGYVRSQIAHHPRMVMATSLNKSFASAGGLVLFPNKQMAQQVRKCGSTLIFSGPIQPPMLGAALASVKLHCSDEIQLHQNKLADLISYTNEGLEKRGLPQYAPAHSPLFFIPVGGQKMITALNQRIMNDGLYLNMAGFPAVPMKRGGLRFMLNNHLTKQDVDQLLESIQRHYTAVVTEQNTSYKEIARSFRIPEFEVVGTKVSKAKPQEEQLHVSIFSSIVDIPVAQWDQFFAGKGNLNHANLRLLEQLFSQQELIENQWQFRYMMVKDQHDEVVLMTFYTDALLKDDMLAKAEISQKVEAHRKLEPYFLTSRQVMLGAMMTKGEHLYVDLKHAQWKKAVSLLLEQLQHRVEEVQASKLLLREFPETISPELEAHFRDLGLVKMELPTNYRLEDLTWTNQTDYLKRLGQKYRYNVKKEVLAHEHKFSIDFSQPSSIKEIHEMYDLYNQVFDRAYELNVFPLPIEFFEKVCQDDAYDIIQLYLKDEQGKATNQLIGCMISQRNHQTYSALIVGLDYDYVRTHNTYKQALYQTVMRGKALGCNVVDLAFTAGLEKKKVGAKAQKVCAFVQAMEHYSMAVLESMSYS